MGKALRLGLCEDDQAPTLLSRARVRLSIPLRIQHPAILWTMGLSRRPDDGAPLVDVHGFPEQDVWGEFAEVAHHTKQSGCIRSRAQDTRKPQAIP